MKSCLLSKEIRIRIWDKKKKEMRYLDKVDLTEVSRNKDVVVMLNTGLTDKNGRDIFVGDIIKGDLIAEVKVPEIIDEFGNVMEYSQPENVGEIFEVVRICGLTGGFEPFVFWYKRHGWFDLCEIEVIGNVFENPELLKGTRWENVEFF